MVLCAQYLCALEQEILQNSRSGWFRGHPLPLATLEKAGKKMVDLTLRVKRR